LIFLNKAGASMNAKSALNHSSKLQLLLAAASIFTTR
jgi:hypothetical protein